VPACCSSRVYVATLPKPNLPWQVPTIGARGRPGRRGRRPGYIRRRRRSGAELLTAGSAGSETLYSAANNSRLRGMASLAPKLLIRL
jgi:hypothetical protein